MSKSPAPKDPLSTLPPDSDLAPADRRRVALVREVRRTADALAVLMPLLSEAQWLLGRRPSTAEDAGRRAKGLTTDPTGEVVVDVKRLRIRRELVQADKALIHAAALLRGAHAALDRAIHEWESSE